MNKRVEAFDRNELDPESLKRLLKDMGAKARKWLLRRRPSSTYLVKYKTVKFDARFAEKPYSLHKNYFQKNFRVCYVYLDDITTIDLNFNNSIKLI